MCLFVCVSHFVSQVPQPTCSWKWMRDILTILCWHPETCQLGNPTTFWLSFNCESWLLISIQFVVSTGGAKQDVGKPPNVPAWNVSWFDHPKSTAHSAEQDIVNLTSNEGNCFWGSYVSQKHPTPALFQKAIGGQGGQCSRWSHIVWVSKWGSMCCRHSAADIIQSIKSPRVPLMNYVKGSYVIQIPCCWRPLVARIDNVQCPM